MRVDDRPEHLGTDVDGFDLNERKVHLFRARRSLPGPNYYQALYWIHRALAPETYVEIGVHEGDSLQMTIPGTACVGIDPRPVVRHPLPLSTRMFTMTSDQFFAAHDLRAVLGGRPFSLAFVDGLHLFEQVLEDFINLEKHAGPDSVLILHDCIPLDAQTSARQRTTHFYSGDVWKVTLSIRECRPDLRMAIIPTAPTGLCLVHGLNPASVSLADDFERIVGEYRDLTYDDYRMRARRMPARIPNTAAAISHYIATRATP
jgi:hypothetical protein